MRFPFAPKHGFGLCSFERVPNEEEWTCCSKGWIVDGVQNEKIIVFIVALDRSEYVCRIPVHLRSRNEFQNQRLMRTRGLKKTYVYQGIAQ